MKKIKIDAQIEGDDIAFVVQKTDETSNVEILGLLDLIKTEVKQNLKNKIKIAKQ